MYIFLKWNYTYNKMGNLCVIFLKRIKNIILKIKGFLSRKNQYKGCLELLWDKYYPAISNLIEEANI